MTTLALHDTENPVLQSGGSTVIEAMEAAAMLVQVDLDLVVRDITPYMAAQLGFDSVEECIGRDLLYLYSTEDWAWLPWSTGEEGIALVTGLIEEACEIGASHREIHFISLDQHVYRGMVSVFFHAESGRINIAYMVGDPNNTSHKSWSQGTTSILPNGHLMGANGQSVSQSELDLVKLYLMYDRDTCLQKTGLTARTFERKIRAIAEKAGFETTTDFVRALALGMVMKSPAPNNSLRVMRPMNLLRSIRYGEGSYIQPHAMPEEGTGL